MSEDTGIEGRFTAPLEIASRFSERWRDCETFQEERTLLRMALLRDVVRELHAEKSRFLAAGKRQDAQEFRAWENRLEELRTAAFLDGDLLELLRSPAPLRKRTRLLPAGLFTVIEREKLERYDRSWEQTIAAEAATQAWCFWALDAWVRVESAEKWHRALGEHLIPHGILLFAENAPAPASVSSNPDLWFGRWTIVLQPTFQTQAWELGKLPGLEPSAPPPRWKLLFSPKKA